METAVSPALAKDGVRTPGALAITLAAYVVTLGSMATVGIVVPQMAQWSAHLHVSVADLGFAIGLFSLPAALFSILLGSVVDRIGAKPAVLLAALIALAGDVVMLGARSLFTLQMAMVIAGIANAVLIAAVPALLTVALAKREQVRAISVWSTYGPAGYALGLLLSAPFTGGGSGRPAIYLLIALMAAGAILAAIVLPNPPRGGHRDERVSLRQVRTLIDNLPLVRVALAYALVAALSYGSSLAAPSYLARVHGVSIASSAIATAMAKIVAMLLGGVCMGWLLGGARNRLALLLVVCGLGLAAQFLLYFPPSGIVLATMAMIGWLFAFGAISATSFVTLAQFQQVPAQAGLAFGLMGQTASIGCFFAPAIYFALNGWAGFVGIAAVVLVLALVIFPRGPGARGNG